MKHTGFTLPIVMVLVLTTLTGCSDSSGGAVTPTVETQTDTYTSPNFDTTYPDALSVQDQLALGTLMLDETDHPFSAEQAAALLPLWQGLRGALNSSTSVQAEINAFLKSIESKMTSDQLAAIREMRLVQSDLVEWMQQQGFGGSQPGESFPGAGGQGRGGGLISPELRATIQAGGEIPPEIRATLEAFRGQFGDGAGGNFSPEAQATFQAGGGFGGNRGGRVNLALIDALIEMLTARAKT